MKKVIGYAILITLFTVIILLLSAHYGWIGLLIVLSMSLVIGAVISAIVILALHLIGWYV